MVFSFVSTPAREVLRDLHVVFVRPTGLVTLPLDQAGLAYVQDSGFQAKAGEWLVLPKQAMLQSRRVALVGLGEEVMDTHEAWRKIGATLSKQVRIAKAKTVVIDTTTLSVSNTSLTVAALAEGMLLAGYTYLNYKAEKMKQEAEQRRIQEVVFAGLTEEMTARCKQVVYETQILVQGTCLTRDLVNTPSGDMTPRHLKERAEQIAAQHPSLSLRVMNREQMKEEKMLGALAVAQGSTEEPFAVHLTYRPTRAAKKKIVLVGKAVTFDSGGLSIKPADSMMDMKCDMAGAAAVLGLFSVLPQLDLDVEVHGIFLAVENMPSGHAYRPGDVVIGRNGVSIEVLNTDAEGRITLADALSYGADLKPDAIIDLATLTGAVVIALGDDLSAIMGTDRPLIKALLASAKTAGEGLWELPLYQPYQDLIKSKVADIKNIGGRPGGSITAGLFLQHFVPKGMAWAHLDIAGPAYTEKESKPDQPFGGTGYGVRLLARYLQGVGRGE